MFNGSIPLFHSASLPQRLSAQVDVVVVSWREKQILLGECKWGLDGIDRQIVRELTEQKAP